MRKVKTNGKSALIFAVLDNFFEISPPDIDFGSFSSTTMNGFTLIDFADLSNTALISFRVRPWFSSRRLTAGGDREHSAKIRQDDEFKSETSNLSILHR